MKKKTLQRITTIILTITMFFSIAACGSAGKETNTDTTAPENKKTAADGDCVELEFWLACNEPSEKYMGRVVEDFNEEFEGKIHITCVPIGESSEDQQAKWQLAGGADQFPDMMQINSGVTLAPYIEAGTIANLYDYLGTDEEFMSRFPEGSFEIALGTAYSEDTFYAFPLETEVQGWYYNKQLFDSVNLEIPETFDELLNCVKVFRENDILPIAHGGIDTWAIWGYHSWFLKYGMDTPEWEKIISGEIKAAESVPLRKTFEKLAALAEAGAYADNVTSTSHTQAMELFYGGGAAMFCVGSWEIESMEKSSIGEYIEFNFGPEFSDGVLEKPSGMRPYNWALACGSKVEGDEVKCQAIATFAKWLTSEERAEIEVEKYKHFPAVKVNTDDIELGRMGKITLEASKADIISLNEASTYCPENILMDYRNAVTSLITGTISVDEALEQIQDWADRINTLG